MADDYLPVLQNLKQSFSLSDIDPNIQFINNLFHQETSGLNFQNLMGFPHENVFPQCPPESFPDLSIPDDKTLVHPNYNDHKDRKRKAMDSINTPETSSAYSSPQLSDDGISKKNSGGKGKRVKGNGKDAEKPLDIVHVRAKRGQATDSHSLAERVRRGKINERLRCLQDIVPGCYKTMGMAVMLDEIINYVQSLQNQVEFLSMKLTAASTSNDSILNPDVIDTLQRAKALETMKIQNLVASHGLPSATFAPLDMNFGYFPQLPHNK